MLAMSACINDISKDILFWHIMIHIIKAHFLVGCDIEWEQAYCWRSCGSRKGNSLTLRNWRITA